MVTATDTQPPLPPSDAATKLDAVIAPRWERFLETVDAVGNALVERLGNMIGGGIEKAAGAANSLGSAVNESRDAAFDRGGVSKSAAPDKPRSQSVPEIEKTPAINPEIIASAKIAAAGLSVQAYHIAEGTDVSPTAVAAVGNAKGGGPNFPG